MQKFKCSNCGNEWTGIELSERKDIRHDERGPVVYCSQCGQYTGRLEEDNVQQEIYKYEPNRVLLKEIVTQIILCLKDQAYYFQMKDIMSEDVTFSSSTAYRRLYGLRKANVLRKVGQDRYTLTEDFRKEMAEKIRKPTQLQRLE